VNIPTNELAFSTVAEVARRVQADLDADWTLDRMATLSGYELHHFAHLFREIIGHPPLRYARLLRLERAATWLEANPDLPVLEVALASGYNSNAAFTRAFTRAFGGSPKAFRRQKSARRGLAQAPGALAAADITDAPPGLTSSGQLEQVGPLHAWTNIIPSFENHDIIAAWNALLAARPPDGPWQLGAVSAPWGWQPGSRLQELRCMRLVDPGDPGPAPPLLGWRLTRRWHVRFDYRGPFEGVVPVFIWLADQWIYRTPLRLAFGHSFSVLQSTDLSLPEHSFRLYLPVTSLRTRPELEGLEGV